MSDLLLPNKDCNYNDLEHKLTVPRKLLGERSVPSTIVVTDADGKKITFDMVAEISFSDTHKVKQWDYASQTPPFLLTIPNHLSS